MSKSKKIGEMLKDTKGLKFQNIANTGGQLSASQVLSIGADAEADYTAYPKQIRLVLAYIELGNTTVADIDAYAVKAEGNLFWGRGVNAYEQTPSKILNHYFNQMTGAVTWQNKLKAKSEAIRVVS